MPREQNTGLTFTQETVLAIRQDGKLIAVEIQNGHIERYACEEATRARSMAIFGADKPNTSRVVTDPSSQT